MPTPGRYSAFLSYHRESGGALAADLQRGLHRFARPWYRLRACRVFRDRTSLGLPSGLSDALRSALDRSEFLLLLASPEAARSEWVELEVRHWLETHGTRSVILALADGELVWDDEERRWSAGPRCPLPDVLRGALRTESAYVDLREAVVGRRDLRKSPAWRDALADIAAELHGVEKDQIAGEDIRQHRRNLWMAWAAALALLLLLGTSLSSWIAGQRTRRDLARSQALEEGRRLLNLAADRLPDDPALGLRLAIEGAALSPGPDANDLLLAGLQATGALRSMAVHLRPVTSLDASPDGRLLLTSSLDGTARLWDLESGNELQLLRGHREAVQLARFDPSGERLFTLTASWRVFLWDASTGELVRTLPPAVALAGFRPFFEASRPALTTGRAPGQLRSFDVERGVELSPPPLSAWELEACFDPTGFYGTRPPYSPDGRWFARREGGVTQVVSSGSGEPVLELSEGSGSAVHAVFSPDGSLLVTTFRGGHAVVRSTADWRVLGVLRSPEQPIAYAEFSPDGRWIVTTAGPSPDSSVPYRFPLQVWRASSLERWMDLRPLDPELSLHQPEFLPDGERILTATSAKHVLVWPLDPVSEAERVCRRTLSALEREAFGLPAPDAEVRRP